jgi:hypothetical protein
VAGSWLFPELDLLDTPKDRAGVHDAAMKVLRRRWQFWVYAIAAPAIGISGFAIGLHFLGKVFPVVARIKGGLLAGAVGGLFPLTYSFAFRRPLRVLIRKELVKRGVPVCVGCGYDLRGQEVARCPECGVGFEEALLGRHGAAACAERDESGG